MSQSSPSMPSAKTLRVEQARLARFLETIN
jgi:hypothetical protein